MAQSAAGKLDFDWRALPSLIRLRDHLTLVWDTGRAVSADSPRVISAPPSADEQQSITGKAELALHEQTND